MSNLQRRGSSLYLSGPFVCNIWSKGMGREACHDNEPAGGGGGGGGGNEPAKLTLTQAELDSMIGKRLGEERKKFEKFEDFKKAHDALPEIQAELQRLKDERELAGKSADEKAAIAAKKASEALDRERQENAAKLSAAEKKAADADKKLRDRIVSAALGDGLDASKVMTSARKQAIKLMMAEAIVELDDNENIVSVTYGGIAHKTAADAATAFLKDNDFMLSAGAPKGAGTKPPNGGGAPGQPADLSSVSLLNAGLAARRK